MKTYSLYLLPLILLPLTAVCQDSPSTTCSITDPPGDAFFPVAIYGAPVPPYLDIIAASVSLRNGTFHFEVRMNANIPATPTPNFLVPVNHFGATVGLLTDQATAGGAFNFFSYNAAYKFNYLVGALYSFADSGFGLPLGWSGFLIDTSTFSTVAIPLQINGDTFVFEASAASLGNPASFNWVVATECDPVPGPQEKRKTLLIEDAAPDQGYASWPCSQP